MLAVTPQMPAESAVELLSALTRAGVDPCVGGGWGVDALLGSQNRAHSDLDLWVPTEQAAELFDALVARGLDRIKPWPDARPWNFVVHDGARLRVDLHFYEPLGDGELHYGSCRAGDTFPAGALDGRGEIAGIGVRCEAPEWSVRWHTGYPMRDVDRHDVALVCERYGLALPPGYR